MRTSRAEDLFASLKEGGERAIDSFISEERSEGLFLDYKRSADDGAGKKLHPTDRKNFGRAISGFGNSEGGVILWGVNCHKDRGDLPDQKIPLQQPNRFISRLEGASSGCTIPPHSGIQHHSILRTDSNEGFVVTLIKKSMFSPHLCIAEEPHRLLVRFGSNFEPAPYALLAGMFGKQPVPEIAIDYQFDGGFLPAPPLTVFPEAHPRVFLRITLINTGVCMAKDLFMNFSSKSPSKTCVIAPIQIASGWHHHRSINGFHLISPPDFRLAPAAMIEPIDVMMSLDPPFDRSFELEITYGCHGTHVRKAMGSTPANVVHDAFEAFLKFKAQPDSGKKLGEAVFRSGWTDEK